MINKKGRIIKQIDYQLLQKTLDRLQEYIEKHIEEIKYHGLNALSFGLSSLFWTYYNDEKEKLEEFEREFNLSDVMKIKGIQGAEIKNNYVEINNYSTFFPKFKVSLRYKKETIIKIIKRKL